MVRPGFLAPLVGGAVLLSFFASSAQAQIVERDPYGGVHVRAPFVDVDVWRGGGVSVRAPFVAVDTPGRRFRAERRPRLLERQPVRRFLAERRPLAAMDDEALRLNLYVTAERLHVQLGDFETGDTWRNYLRLAEDVLADLAAMPPEERRAMLAQLLDRFRFVMAQREYEQITELPAFQSMQALLSEALSRLDERQPERDTDPEEELPLPEPQVPELQLSPRQGPELQLPPLPPPQR